MKAAGGANDGSQAKPDINFGSVRSEATANRHGSAPWSHAGFFVIPSPWLFRVWWVVIALVHVICIGTFGLQCWAYWRIPYTNVAVGFEMYEVIMPLSDFHALSLVHGAIAAAHGLLLLQMVVGSMHSRQLAFHIPIPKNLFRRGKQLKTPTPSDVEKHSTKFIYRLKTIASTISRLHEKVFGRRGLLGIEGKYFVLIYIIREVFETVLQSHQAYNMSQLVPHVAINRFFVFSIVGRRPLFSISSPTAHRWSDCCVWSLTWRWILCLLWESQLNLQCRI